MTTQEILIKAIEKALHNGWDRFGKKDNYFICTKCGQEASYGSFVGSYDSDCGGKWKHNTRPVDPPFMNGNYWVLGWTNGKGDYECMQLSDIDIMFNHGFAKAIFGKYPQVIISYKERARKLDCWQYHLQQMVIAEDPIKYLGENI